MGQRIKPQDQMDTQDLTAGQGPVSDPSGIAAAGGTPDQAKMAGTPAQTQANIEMQKRAQDQRIAEQEQASAAEQQRLAGETLAQQKRYERPSPATEGQQEAVQIAQTLNTLGPVRTRVQSLIQERLQSAQTAATSLQVNEQAVASIQDPAKRQAAQTALNAYITNPTEQNLQAIYDAIGSEKTEDLQQFFTTPEGTVQESFQAAFEIAPTLGSLDLTAAGVDMAELASTLGIPEAQLQGMTLDQLNQQIAAIEASELNRTEQLQAQLQDPTLSPAMRESIIAELQQMGAAGVIEAERDIEDLQAQIDTANTVDILGREMSVEQLLSDEGLSSLVAQAATDPDMLQALKDDPEYASLAGWIEQNKAALSVLAAEYEERGEEFVDLQDKYKELKESLGADGLELLQSIYGEEFSSSVLSGELEDIKAKLEATPLYRTLTKKGNEKYAALLKEDPELAKQIMESGFEDTEIEYAFDIKEHMDQGGYFGTLLSDIIGEDVPEGGYIFDQKFMDNIRKQDLIERYDNIDPALLSSAQDLQNLTSTDGAYLDLDQLETMNELDAEDRSEVIADLQANIKLGENFDKNYGIKKDKDGNIVSADIKALMTKFFGRDDVDYMDLTAQLRSPDVSKEAKQLILDVFDKNGDERISADEMSDDDQIATKLLDHLNIADDIDSIISGKGDYEHGTVDEFTVPENAFENSVDEAFDEDFITDVDDYYKGQKDEYNRTFKNGLANDGSEDHLTQDVDAYMTSEEALLKNFDSNSLPKSKMDEVKSLFPVGLDKNKDGSVSIRDIDKFKTLTDKYTSMINDRQVRIPDLEEDIKRLNDRRNSRPWYDEAGRNKDLAKIRARERLVNLYKDNIRDFSDAINKVEKLRTDTLARVDKYNAHQKKLKGYNYNVNGLIKNFSKYAKIGKRSEDQQKAYDKYAKELTDRLNSVYGDKKKWPENIRWLLGG